MTRLVLLFGLIIVTAATFANEPMPGALYWSAIPVILIVGLLAEALHRGRRNQRTKASVTSATMGGADAGDTWDVLDFVWDGFRDDPIGRESVSTDEIMEADTEPLPIENNFVDSVVDGVTGARD